MEPRGIEQAVLALAELQGMGNTCFLGTTASYTTRGCRGDVLHNSKDCSSQ